MAWEHFLAKLFSPLFRQRPEHPFPPSAQSPNNHTPLKKHENPFSLLWRSLRTRKLLLTGLIVLTIGAPIIYLSLKYQSKIEAAWYDDSFTYRQTVNITNSGTAQTDFQVNIGIGTSALIAAGKMQADCDDIRVTDNNGKILPYWIETGANGCNATTTNVWTKVPSIPTSGATVYIYYGNPSTTTAQNGDQVFLFFDDFSGSSVNTAKWNIQHSSYVTVSSGNLELTGGSSASTDGGVWTTTNFATQYIVNTRANLASSWPIIAWNVQSNNQGYAEWINPSDSMGDLYKYTFCSTGTCSYSNLSVGGTAAYTFSSFTTVEVIVNGTNYTIKQNGSTKSVYTHADLSGGGIGLEQYATGPSRYDWIFVRKYAATPPSVASPTNEEKSQGPVAYFKFDEGYGTQVKDSGPRNLTGNMSSGITWQDESMCVSGKCLYFDGVNNTGVTVANVPVFTPSDNWSVSFWTKTDPSAVSWQNAVALSNGDAAAWGILANHSSNIPLFYTSTAATGASNQYFNPPAQTFTNDWKHYVLTKNSSTYTWYINGKSVASQNKGGGDVTNNTGSSWAFGFAWAGRYKGYLDEIKIYPYARTAAQIKSDYAAGLAHASSVKGISASMGSNSKNSSALSQGLVGYWKLDETSGNALDSSGSGYTGVWSGSSNHYVSGKFGNSGGFASVNSDTVSLGTTLLNNVNTGTVSMWINATAAAANGGQPWLNTTMLSNDNIYLGIQLLSSYKIRAYYWDTNSTANYLDSNSAVALSNWYFITYTWDSSGSQLYINGVLDNSSTTLTWAKVHSGHLNQTNYLGSISGGSYYYSGKLDELRLYNRALSPKEVRDLYNWAPGPVGYWNFEEGTGGTVNDRSGVGNTGTWNGTGSHWTNGKYGKAGNFNGTDDYVNAGNNASLSGMNDVTMEAWVRTNSNDNQQIARNQGALYFTLIYNGGLLYLRPALQIGGVWHDYGNVQQVPINKWVHLAFTKRASDNYITTYVNGVAKTATKSGSEGQIASTANPLLIGSDRGIGYWFNGQIDDVRIYNYARTQKQITEDMNAGHPSVGSPVGSAVGHYKFDEGYGATAHSSGNGGSTLDATLGTGSSAPTWTNNGKFGKALSFDGSNDKITVSDNDALTPTDITFSLWINSPNISGSQTFIGKWYVGTNQRSYYLYTGTSNVGLCISKDGTDSGASCAASANNTLGNNTWYHIAAVYHYVTDGTSTIQIYINGKLSGSSSTAKGPIYNSTGNLNFSTYDGTNQAYNGIIDEVKIYSYALTEDEVKLDYNHGSALVLGSTSTDSSGNPGDNSSAREYCIPGDTSTCNAPVGEWTFNEGIGGTAFDTSGNNNNGTWNGTGSHWTNGKIGKAGNFNGSDDYVSVADTTGSPLDATNSLTIEAWVKNRGSIASMQSILRKEGAYTLRYAADGSLSGIVWIGGTPRYTSTVASADAWDTNNWNHWVFVYTGNQLQMFKNGRKIVNDVNQTGTINVNDNALGIGAVGDGSYKLNGLIDQVRIFNYARSPAQIAWDYNRGAPVGHWKLDEGQGTTANDATGNNNNGNINIGASGTQTTAGTITSPTDGTGAWYNGRTGKLNYSLSFDGTDDYVGITHSQGNNIKTVSAWFKLNNLPTGTPGGVVLANANSTSGPTGFDKLLRVTTAGKIQFYFNDDNGRNATGTTTLTTGVWYHAVGVTEGSRTVVYLNGKEEGSYASVSTSSGNYAIINFNDTAYSSLAQAINGQIDDVRIYNYALTAQQIKTLYSSGAVTFDPPTSSP